VLLVKELLKIILPISALGRPRSFVHRKLLFDHVVWPLWRIMLTPHARAIEIETFVDKRLLKSHLKENQLSDYRLLG